MFKVKLIHRARVTFPDSRYLRVLISLISRGGFAMKQEILF